jgi:hypothetical protein
MAEENTESKETAKGNVDEVALELMKFIALTTGYGKPGSSSAGFAGKATKSGPDEYADALLGLFSRCRDVVKGGNS